jgi:acid stress chaperone HdeB
MGDGGERSGNLRERMMTRLKLITAWLALSLLAAPPAQAQVLLDVSKITCEQFVLWKVTDPDKIVIWMSGYYNAKRGNTIIDTKALEENAGKLREYCRNNFKITVMQAVETLLAASK